MSGGKRNVLLIFSLLFVSLTYTSVLDVSPTPAPSHWGGFPGGIDWGNLVFPNVSGDCIAQLAKMAGQGVNATYAQSKFIFHLLFLFFSLYYSNYQKKNIFLLILKFTKIFCK